MAALNSKVAPPKQKSTPRKLKASQALAQIEYWPLARFIPYARNPRKNDHAVDRMVASIREFGFKIPVLARSSGEVVDGHLRLKAAARLSLEPLPVILCDDWTEAQVKAFRLMVNRSVGWADWDAELLGPELLELQALDLDLSLTGFDADELKMFMADPTEGLTDPDDCPAPQAEAISVAGDLWLLGEHRLLCGDSTSVTDVERLMAGGIEKADLVFTDPPYGVGYTGGAKRREALAGDQVGTNIYAEALPMLQAAAADHAALYLWYADAHVAAAAAAAAGYIISAQIIWVKNNAQFVSSAHYHGKHEPCFYAHRKGKSAAWYGENNQVTVWDVDRANKNEFHPTQKPVELARRAIENSSKTGDIVLDLFGGSGSTLIAAEATGRKARLMEIAPQYVDVICRRFAAHTGKQATLETGGTFAELEAERSTKSAAA